MDQLVRAGLSEEATIPHVVCSGVGKTFGATAALEGISISFGPGTTAVLGRNGAGKSTLFNVIAGIVTPTRGTVTVDGEEAGSPASSSLVSRQPEFPVNSGIKPRRLSRLFLFDSATSDRLRSLLYQFDVPDKPLDSQSRGNRSKIALAVALARDTPVTLLDEPTTGLDPIAIAVLFGFLDERRKRGALTLVATHQPTFEPGLFDAAIVIERGHLVFSGGLASLLAESGLDPATPSAQKFAAALTRYAVPSPHSEPSV